MRAAARKATRQITALAINERHDGEYEDDQRSSSTQSTDDQQDSDQEIEEEDDADLNPYEEYRNALGFDIGSIEFRTGRRTQTRTPTGATTRGIAQIVGPRPGSVLPLRSVRKSVVDMAGPRGSNGIARQNIRDNIVQRWDPSSTNGTFSAANGSTGHMATPLTPPMNDEDEAVMRRRDREEKIMRSVEENGIEKPKGHSVSYHYNKRVENMHFGRTHPMKPWRLTLTKHLVLGYGLQYAMDNYEALPATRETVEAFHDSEYTEFLSKVSPETFEELCKTYEHRIPPSYEGEQVTLGPFNLSTSPGADCPVFDGMNQYLFLYTGATMEAVSKLTNGQSDIAINWTGGLHHAHKSEASGFCYINDIVLAIIELLKCHQRVLYIDIDVHHGDGVEEAFASSDRVMTLSYHRYGKVQEDKNVESHLFFPGTGSLTDNGNPGSMGHHFALNVPIPSGIDDDQFLYLFREITGKTLEKFRPQAIVLQCGADSLGGDRLGQFNLNIRAHGECLAFVKKERVPLLVIGGGGYTARNVARAWTHETALAVDCTLNEDLPMHIVPRPEAFSGKLHGDGKLYPELAGFHPNKIHQKELDTLVEHCHEELRYIEHAPSVVMERLPSEAAMEAIRRQVDEEMEADRAAESSHGERERRRRERNPAGRGELR